MLQHLTAYLLHYRTVTIPHVGTVRLVRQPAQADVAAKLILPPHFTAELESGDEVSGHQLEYLAASSQKGSDAVLAELKAFGNRLLDAMNGPGFEWAGIGRFTRSTTSVAIPIDDLQAVQAQKHLREAPNHALLVGDRETTAQQLADERAEAAATNGSKNPLVIVGWVLLALSILAIAYLLYTGKFNVGATGSRQMVYVSAKPPFRSIS